VKKEGEELGRQGARRTLPRTRLDAFKCELIAGLRCIYEAQDLCPPDESAVGQVEVWVLEFWSLRSRSSHVGAIKRSLEFLWPPHSSHLIVFSISQVHERESPRSRRRPARRQVVAEGAGASRRGRPPMGAGCPRTKGPERPSAVRSWPDWR